MGLMIHCKTYGPANRHHRHPRATLSGIQQFSFCFEVGTLQSRAMDPR